MSDDTDTQEDPRFKPLRLTEEQKEEIRKKTPSYNGMQDSGYKPEAGRPAQQQRW